MKQTIDGIQYYDHNGVNPLIKIIRVKSDNVNAYMSVEAYRELTLQMSSGDFGSHKSRAILVSNETLQDLKFHRPKGPGYIDYMSGLFYFCSGDGDIIVDEAL
jgi:hypothetical protein